MKLPIAWALLMVLTGLAQVMPSAIADSSPATNQDYWAVEDASARTNLPLYVTLPAAKTEELTPANGYPKRSTFLTTAECDILHLTRSIART
jgi:hypothetical protein